MLARVSRHALPVLATLALFSSSRADAGAIVVTYGDRITHLGDASAQSLPEVAGGKVGYKHGYWGVFWVDLWTHSGTFCVYQGERYHPISRAEAAQLLGKREDELWTPILYTIPLGWPILGAIIGVFAIVGSREDREQKRIQSILEDERYRSAAEKVFARMKQTAPAQPSDPSVPPEEPEAFQARFQAAVEVGVDELVRVGIPREEAERDLSMMIQVILHAHSTNQASAS
ncbi:MAG: hypothetical protein SFX72_12910 [Isosphaeraceae bacterium]|nr:hypothetical protein [Isosphaeraceae bacterium]